MSRGGARRRLRVRRKRKKESVVGEIAGDAAEAAGEVVVAEFGCCLIEAVGSVAVLVGLFVPLYFWMA